MSGERCREMKVLVGAAICVLLVKLRVHFGYTFNVTYNL